MTISKKKQAYVRKWGSLQAGLEICRLEHSNAGQRGQTAIWTRRALTAEAQVIVLEAELAKFAGNSDS